MIRALFVLILILVSCLARAEDYHVAPNMGLNFESLDYYDINGGVIIEKKPYALNPALSLNHMRAGADIAEVKYLGETISNSLLVFLKQRFMYFWSSNLAGNIHHIEGPAIAIEVGAGVTGHSLMISAFIGYAVPLDEGGSTLYSGLGVNY
jgi:hypothetical protein